MPEYFTYFPFDSHLITSAQRRAWHISHINTSLSVVTLEWVRVENLTKNVCMSENLIIRGCTTLKLTISFKKSAICCTLDSKSFHIFTCGIVMWKVLYARGGAVACWGGYNEYPITRDGLCHLPARVVDHSLSRQFAEHDLSHLIRVIISRHPQTMTEVMGGRGVFCIFTEYVLSMLYCHR